MIACRGYPEGGVGLGGRLRRGHHRHGGRGAEADPHLRHAAPDALRRCRRPARARGTGSAPQERRIPLPGLANPETQLGIPLLVRDELVGVLCIESEQLYRFHEEDRAYLEVLGGYLAIAIQNALLRERAAEEGDGTAAGAPDCRQSTRPGGRSTRIEVEYYTARRVHSRRRRVPHPRPARQDPVEGPARARSTTAPASSPTASCASTSRWSFPPSRTTSRAG